MMSHDEMLDNVAAYALGVLSPAQAAMTARHLETCEQCREEYRFLRPAVTAIAYSAQAEGAQAPAIPSALLKARIMKQVRATTPRRFPMHVWPAYAVAAACLALAIIAGAADFRLNARLDRDRAQLAAQAAVMADLSAPDSQRYAFAGGQVFTRGERLYIAMHDLPQPPRGRVYQAWTLAKGAKTVAPSLTFLPAAGRVAIVKLPQNATNVAAVAVSVEPVGGSKQPTTKPIALVRI
ncbi:MAG: anti-sigma factor [Candidatus Eremiobacteraeota bacterium]|nr:anti-sigma factor [Candidatus Eremiobacteraeota bacterium]